MLTLSIQDLADLRSAIDIAMRDPNAWMIKNDLQRLHGALSRFQTAVEVSPKSPSPAAEIEPSLRPALPADQTCQYYIKK